MNSAYQHLTRKIHLVTDPVSTVQSSLEQTHATSVHVHRSHTLLHPALHLVLTRTT